MLYVTSLAGTVVFLVAATLLFAIWPVCWDLLERRGRIASHTMLDFAVAFFVLSPAVSLILGSVGSQGDPPRIFTQLSQQNGALVGIAVFGGLCSKLADIALQYAVAYSNVYVAPSITNATELAVGIIASYFLDAGLNRAAFIYPGLVAAIVAVVMGALANWEMQKAAHVRGIVPVHDDELIAQEKAAIEKAEDDTAAAATSTGVTCVLAAAPSTTASKAELLSLMGPSTATSHSSARAITADPQAIVPSKPPHQNLSIGTNPSISHFQPQLSIRPPMRTASSLAPMLPSLTLPLGDESSHGGTESSPGQAVHRPPSKRLLKKCFGVLMAIASGTLYATVFAAYNVACNDTFHLLAAGVPPLTAYTTLFYAGTSSSIALFTLYWIFLYHPPLHARRSTLSAYLRDWRGRGWGLLAGACCVIADLGQMQGGNAQGYAFAYMVQVFPIVSTLLSIIIYRELGAFSMATKAYLALQTVFYIACVVLLGLSATSRPNEGAPRS